MTEEGGIFCLFVPIEIHFAKRTVGWRDLIVAALKEHEWETRPESGFEGVSIVLWEVGGLCFNALLHYMNVVDSLSFDFDKCTR